MTTRLWARLGALEWSSLTRGPRGAMTLHWRPSRPGRDGEFRSSATSTLGGLESRMGKPGL